MKRYLAFTGDEYEPEGGMKDFSGDFETLNDALRYFAPIPDYQWGHVLDTHTGEVTEIPGVPSEPCACTLADRIAVCDVAPIPGTFVYVKFKEGGE